MASTLRVRVQPRASRDALGGEREGPCVVRLTAPPVEGAANRALARLLGRALGVAPSAVADRERRRGPQQARGRDRDRRATARGVSTRWRADARWKDPMIHADSRRPAHRPPGHARGRALPAPGRRCATSRRCRDAAVAAAGGTHRLGRRRRRLRPGCGDGSRRPCPRRRGGRGRPRSRRPPHPPRLRRRPRRRAPAAPGRGLLPGDRRRRRRDRPQRRGHPQRLRRGPGGGRRGAPRRDAPLRHDHRRGEERLRPRDRGRAPQPRGDPPRRLPPPGDGRAHLPRCPRGPPRAPGPARSSTSTSSSRR